MTTINSNVTVENHAEVLRLAVLARDAAKTKRDSLQAVFEGRTAPKTDFDTDPAVVSGIRRNASGSMRQRQEASFGRDIDAYKAFQAAEAVLVVLERRVERLRSGSPVPYTEDELRAASLVRTDEGWYPLLKVNKVTVGVEAGFPWPHKIARGRVLEVR